MTPRPSAKQVGGIVLEQCILISLVRSLLESKVLIGCLQRLAITSATSNTDKRRQNITSLLPIINLNLHLIINMFENCYFTVTFAPVDKLSRFQERKNLRAISNCIHNTNWHIRHFGLIRYPGKNIVWHFYIGIRKCVISILSTL